MSRKIVENVLTRQMTLKVWTGNYFEVVPLSLQDFQLTSVLPAVFYMFRWGHRRGKGNFLDTYGGGEETQPPTHEETGTKKRRSKRERARSATVNRIASMLAEGNRSFSGFYTETGRAILADLLLCYCVENAKHALGRNEQVMRVAPTHYMASWVDLPAEIAHLRYVPEMLVGLLANQRKGDHIEKTAEKSWFAVGRQFEENVLLEAFRNGMYIKGTKLGDQTSDSFRESTPVAIDQLLMIRFAQTLRGAPDALRGKGGERISNQKPIAIRSSDRFSEDLHKFIQGYGRVVPRQTLVPMLESCFAIGLVSILTASMEVAFQWEKMGGVGSHVGTSPSPLFVDCSCGIHRQLRSLAEESFENFMRRLDRFPVVLMCLRLLDYRTRYDSKLREEVPKSFRPYSTIWLDLLGQIVYSQHPRSEKLLDRLDEDCVMLAEALRDESPEVAEILEDTASYPNPAWRFAEGLCILMGRKNLQQNLFSCLDSCLLIGRPNGIGAKRRVTRTDPFTGRRSREVRSLVLSDTALDYLVHLHIVTRGGKRAGTRALSFKRLLQIFRERYGYCIDESPPGMSISNELLQANRSFLERRLRDLGLLIGVNDAEAMRTLVSRFEVEEESPCGTD